jgi:hypothetical protein
MEALNSDKAPALAARGKKSYMASMHVRQARMGF